MNKLEYRLWIIGSRYGDIITNNEYNHIENVLIEGGSSVEIIHENGNITIYPISQIHKLTKRII